uniref:AMP-activated protein kinase glycogen-binding domain-containing protein n=1 Tax=Plectus sambesii TaxID=2011161 RepID=A0A914V1Q8_9BILA
MDESGYCDTMSQHSNNANEDPTITVTVEPVDLVVEKDGSVLLSNLQSALPGAHGLYYYHLGHRKAVKYDGQVAKIVPPSDGWGARSYFVTLAHGCRASLTGFGSYENASKQFERSVSLVQKMFGGVDSANFERRKTSSIKGDGENRARSQPIALVSNQNGETNRAQDTESLSSERLLRLETTIERLTNKLTAKEHQIQLLKEENHDLRSQAETSSVDSRSVVEESTQSSTTDLGEQYNEQVDSSNKLSEENASLRVQIDDLSKELENTRSRLNEAEQSTADSRQKLEWKSTELLQHWNDAKWKIGELEAALGTVNADVAYKNERISQLDSELASVSDKLRESNEKNFELEQTIASKQNEVDQLTQNEVDQMKQNDYRLREMSESQDARNGELVERIRCLEQELAHAHKTQELPVAVECICSQLQQSLAKDEERIRDLEQQLVEKRESYNRLEQDGTSLRQKLEGELEEANQSLNDVRLRTGELEEHLRQNGGSSDEKERVVEQLTEQLQSATKELDECRRALGELESKHAEVNSKREYMEQELCAAKKYLADGAHSAPARKSDSHGDMLELSDELMKVNMRKYELENQVAQMSADLKAARQRADQSVAAQQEIAKNLWVTGERLAEAERELHRLHSELHEAHCLIDQLRHEQTEREDRIAHNVPEAHHLHEELRVTRESMAALAASESEARQKAEWVLGEVTQAWNDAKWRIGEMEAAMAHKQWELDQAKLRVHELEQLLEKLQSFKSKASKVLDGSFLIRKQPYVDRTKWSLSMWDENTPADGDLDYRRIWFDIEAPNARNVYLMGSFVNWECGMMCTATGDGSDRKGVWVDLPRGRYEFRFLVDGEWRTASDFPTCPNDFGSENNWRFVD